MKRVLAVTAVLLAGCSNPPTEGEVTRKQHSEAYSYITMHCIANDPKTFACTAYMPVTNNMPARWELCLINRDDKTHDEQGCIEVGEIAWNKYRIGDYYPDKG